MNDKPLPYQPIQYLYEQYCKRLGIVQKSSHKSRKTYISTLYDAGVNINSIREFVGHADEQTTLHNYCYDRKSQQEKLEQVEKALAIIPEGRKVAMFLKLTFLEGKKRARLCSSGCCRRCISTPSFFRLSKTA